MQWVVDSVLTILKSRLAEVVFYGVLKYHLWTQSQWKAHVTNKEPVITSVCDLFAKKS